MATTRATPAYRPASCLEAAPVKVAIGTAEVVVAATLVANGVVTAGGAGALLVVQTAHEDET